jgi:hypothetical protein
LLAEDLENRVLDFDAAAAVEAAALAATRQKAGHPVDMRDTQIAGIALVQRASIATRNVRRFEDLKVPIVKLSRLGAAPWSEEFYAFPESRCLLIQRTCAPITVLKRSVSEVLRPG